jgi:nucleoid-associated protein YgaU
MGLFSFIKDAGASIFGGGGKSAEEEKQDRIKQLYDVISDLALEVENLQIDLNGDTVILNGKVESQSEKEKVILAVGNVNGVAQVDDRLQVEKPEPEAVFYEVKSGDSLSKIAKAQYGDAMKYPVIFEANKPMLKDPDKIYPGQVLLIPPLS